MDRPIISVHFPKSGGTAFRLGLKAALGDALLDSYDDDPAEPTHLRRVCPAAFLRARPLTLGRRRAVHGHFAPHTYDLIPDALRIVMLREPVETLTSIFFYWRSIADAPRKGALHELAVRERLSLLEAAEMPLLRRLMSRTYFGGYDMRRFDVIGAFERRSAFFAAVSEKTGLPLRAEERANVTPPFPERDEAMADARLMARLRSLLADDIRFYETHAHGGRRGSGSKPVFVPLRRIAAALPARLTAGASASGAGARG